MGGGKVMKKVYKNITSTYKDGNPPRFKVNGIVSINKEFEELT